MLDARAAMVVGLAASEVPMPVTIASTGLDRQSSANPEIAIRVAMPAMTKIRQTDRAAPLCGRPQASSTSP
jgi:hypothetical protein